MDLFGLLFALIAGLAFIVLTKAPDEAVHAGTWARRILRDTLILMGGGIAFWLLITIGEAADGDMTSVFHLVPMAMIAILLVLAWRLPLDVGVAAVIFGVIALGYAYRMVTDAVSQFQAVLFIGVPLLVSGVLLTAVGAVARRAAQRSVA